MIISINLTAGVPVTFNEPGNFFRLMSATNAVDIDFYKNGQEIADAYGVTGGYAESFSGQFDRFMIKSETTQTVQIASRLGNMVSYDAPPSGNVSIQNFTGWFGQAGITVTNVSQMFFGGSGKRRYVFFQNNHSSGNIFIYFADGGTATPSNGIKLGPGQSYELNSFCPTHQIQLIGDIPSNSDVIAIVGE